MPKSHLTIPVGRPPLDDNAFSSRVSKNFLGDVRGNLSLELHDLSEKREAEALALVVEYSKNGSSQADSRLVFRVDRQSLEHLAGSLDELLKQERVGLQKV